MQDGQAMGIFILETCYPSGGTLCKHLQFFLLSVSSMKTGTRRIPNRIWSISSHVDLALGQSPIFIIRLCLTSAGFHQIHKFERLKSIGKAFQIFPSRQVIFLLQKSWKLKCKIIDYFHLTIFIYKSAKKPDEKKSKGDEQTLARLNSTHHPSQAK